MRKSFLPWLVCAAIAAVGVPALAWGEPGGGRIEAPTDAAFVTGDNFFQDTAGAAGDNSVTITPGGKVTFTSPVNETNSAVHNVDFDFDTQPTSCNQTQEAGGVPGLDTDGKAPMPASPLPPGWVGECTFTTPGTYNFFCQAHGGMEGTVVVSGTATPTPTPTATPTHADADGHADADADGHADADTDGHRDPDTDGDADRPGVRRP